MNRFVIFLCIYLSYLGAFSQQQVQNGLYMFNPLAVNPAYVGSHDAFSAVLNYRNQWVGIKGAPTYMNFSMHAPVKSKHIGVGLSTNTYALGANKSTGINLDVMYRIQLNRGSRQNAKKDTWLAMGLRGGINFFQSDFNNLRVMDPIATVDPTYQIRGKSPYVGAGIYYYGQRFYAGLSVPDYFQKKSTWTNAIVQLPHYNVMGGIVIPIKKGIDFKPSVNFIITKNAPINGDLNASFFFYNRIWLGAMYRLSRAAGLNMALQITDMFQLGYAYEYNFSMLRSFSSGTHELVLIFDIKKPKTFVRTRYF